MANVDIIASSCTCRKCGRTFKTLRNYFPVSYGDLYKGLGHLPYCRECVDKIYMDYYMECEDSRKAARMTCRKLDLYWSDTVFEMADKQGVNRTLMSVYLSRLTAVRFSGLSYDDTLREEGTLWSDPAKRRCAADGEGDEFVDDEDEISDEVIAFWGPGYTPTMYRELEQRREFWMSRHPDGENLGLGAEALIRQICSLEIDINKDRAAGKPVDKSINTLNTLLGSADLKPTQKKDESADAELEKMPLGVGIQKWEFDRPLPATPEDRKDVRGTIKNITVWYLGHACKMAGIKNSYSRAYEEAMEELRVKKPEYENEEDDDVLYDFFNGGLDG